ncbi:MAG: class I SAM-dependent methyltransferase [Thermogutta sp.]
MNVPLRYISERVPHCELVPELQSNSVLLDIFAKKRVVSQDGKVYELSSGISIDDANALYRVVRKLQPEVCVEIGMAYGISTLTILTGLAHNGRGRLISIDRYYHWDSGLSIALSNVQRAGFSHMHMHIREPSFRALPKLLLDNNDSTRLHRWLP